MADDIHTARLYIYKAPPGSSENAGCIYDISVRIQGPDINSEEIIEELRDMLSRWALTWLRQDCTISLKAKGGDIAKNSVS